MSISIAGLRENRVAAHQGGALSPDDVQRSIDQAWRDLVRTAAGRARIADALKIAPQELVPGPAPLEVEQAPSGCMPAELLIAVHWAAVNIGVPVLVALAKDEAKARLLQLWQQVLLPTIRERHTQTAIDQEVPLP